MMKHIIGSFVQYENDVKSERTIAGMKQAAKEGRWVLVAPVGYTFEKDLVGKSVLRSNEKADFIKLAFEMAAKGIHTQTEICRVLRGRGFGMYKQNLNQILRNPVYAGLIVRPQWFDAPVKAIHVPIVSERQFYKIQQLLSGKRPGLRPRLRYHPDFPL